jgi:hypothetical protein
MAPLLELTNTEKLIQLQSVRLPIESPQSVVMFKVTNTRCTTLLRFEQF